MSKLFDVEQYKSLKNWNDVYPDYNVQLSFSSIPQDWAHLMKNVIENNNLYLIESLLKEHLKSGKKILPYPSLVFSFFSYTKYDELKVVFLGQDPYFNIENDVPLAMGMSFSVPHGISIPSSLNNIYNNMIKFGHINKFPSHGNLEEIAKQGCLFLNAALTVNHKEPNSHADLWSSFTDSIIKNISKEKDNVIFVLWGAFARNKSILIDKNKHKILITSHPSGMSCNKKLGDEPAFSDFDHFGTINKILKDNGKRPINWNVDKL